MKNSKKLYIFAIQNKIHFLMIVKNNLNGKIDIVTNVEVISKSVRDFADIMLKFISIFKSNDKQLSKTEKEFMLISIMAQAEGFKLYDKNCVDYIKKNSEFNTKYIIDKHRMHLIKSQWIEKDGHRFSIPDIFNKNKYEKEVKIDFSIKNA